MCQNPLVIRNRANFAFYEVPCRHCLDCLLDKSSQLFRMIISYKRNHYPQLFVTLTYDNKHVPYLKLSEISNFFVSGEIPFVYRDEDYYFFRSHGKLKFKTYHSVTTPFRFPGKLNLSALELPRLVKYHTNKHFTYFPDRVGVLNNRDLQRLFKSLRNFFDFSYYVIGEYGENTFRPHWHILFYLKDCKSLDLFKSYIIRYWRFCPPANMRFLKTLSVEKYVSMYVTKVSKYNNALFQLQRSFAFYSRDIGRSLDFNLNSLDSSLHYRKTHNGITNEYLPTTRESKILMPIVKQSLVPLSWHSIFKSFFFEPKKMPRLNGFYNLPSLSGLYRYSSFEPISKYKVSPVYRSHVRCLKVNHISLKNTNLSNLIDYSIKADEFHRKIASQRLKDYLMSSPTVYSRHKRESLNNNHFMKDYGFKPNHQIRHFLNNYECNNVKDYTYVNKFNLKQHLNQYYYEYK